MIKRILLIALSLCAMLGASAATADDVLRKSSQALTSGHGITATFTAVTDNQAAAKGSFTMAKEKFALVTPEYASWFNGEDLWSFSDQTGETTLSNPTQQELMEINPFEIIRRYSASYKAKSKSAPQGKYTVELTPKSKDASVRRAVVTVSASTYLPTSVVIDFSNGTSTSVTINSITVKDQAIPASVFQYPEGKYPGVEVIDLR